MKKFITLMAALAVTTAAFSTTYTLTLLPPPAHAPAAECSDLVDALAVPISQDLDFMNVAGVGPSILNLPARMDKQGVIRLATQTEVNTGTDLTTAVSPGTLAASIYATGRFTATVGGAATIPVNHNLGSIFVSVTAFEVAAPFREIEVEVQHTNNNTITLAFAAAQPAASVNVLVQR